MKLLLELHLVVLKYIIHFLAHPTTSEIKPIKAIYTLYCRVLLKANFTARLAVDIASLF